MLYPFELNLLTGIFRIPSLRSNNRKILYYISKIIKNPYNYPFDLNLLASILFLRELFENKNIYS